MFNRKKDKEKNNGQQSPEDTGKNKEGSKKKSGSTSGSSKKGMKGFFDRIRNRNSDKEMSFIGHIEELRKRIIAVLAVFAVAFVPAFLFRSRIMDFLTAPLADKKLVFLEITEPFLVNVKLAFFAAAAVALPVLVYQVVVFIRPALSQKVRKNLLILTIIFFILFAGGIAFSYKLLIPVAVKWLLSQGANLEQALSVNKYVSFIGWFLIGTGILFEMPLILLFLIKAEIITVPQLRKQWRVVYIIILVLCAIITPDWSPVTMGVLAVPMILLYEMALLLARFFK
ncbi:MAG: twin-arginine translocase subunit TatC [Actinobacteria bacterium]|nr:twin-arginine translocase subunit TatC [Actinomycetota bacterium]